MIKLLRFIGSVGCFDTFTGTADTEFRPLNLIYAENGRGKTTLVAILRSLAEGNPAPITGRKRLGAQHDPRVVVELDDGTNRVFQNGAWSAVYDSLLIFDDHFVDDNVYSGLTIGADHRQNLHEVILGSQGVSLKRRVDSLAERIAQLTRDVREKQNAIPVEALNRLDIDTFCGLPEPGSDDNQRRSEISRQLTALEQAERVRSTRFFSRIEFPAVDVDAIQVLLNRKLDDLDAIAVSLVQDHLTQLGPGAERWVADGVPRIFASGETQEEHCPFCGQTVSEVDLVDKYRAYFGQAYRELQAAIDEAHRRYTSSFGGDELARVQREFVQLADQHTFWKTHVTVPEFQIELDQLVAAWQTARDKVLEALSAKRAAPLEARDLPPDSVEAVEQYAQLVGEFTEAVEALVARNDDITAVKLTDFLEVDLEEINRQQRIILVAEAFDYSLLIGAEWLSERFGVDVTCCRIAVARDASTNSEYLVCSNVYPAPELAQEAVPRGRRTPGTSKIRWADWDVALASVDNRALVSYYRQQLDANRENYLRKRILHFRIDGKRRWFMAARKAKAYVWQNGRFDGDIDFWRKGVSVPDEVKPVKEGMCLSFFVSTEDDFRYFHQAATRDLMTREWSDTAPEEGVEEADVV